VLTETEDTQLGGLLLFLVAAVFGSPRFFLSVLFVVVVVASLVEEAIVRAVVGAVVVVVVGVVVAGWLGCEELVIAVDAVVVWCEVELVVVVYTVVTWLRAVVGVLFARLYRWREWDF